MKRRFLSILCIWLTLAAPCWAADLMVRVDTAVTVPVNAFPLTDDTDFKSRETGVAYNASGMDLVWNFQTAAGVTTQTAVTPTTSGTYDWTHAGDGIYYIEIPASGGASINNDTEGTGWFSGVATGVMPWRGPTIQFSPSTVTNAFVDGSEWFRADTRQFNGSNVVQSGGRLQVNADQVEGSDATDQIRDAVVDDATRIDATGLNTLAGHDPGETIMGATDTVTLNPTQGNVSFLEFAITEGLAVSTTDANESAATYTGNGTGHGTLYTSGSGATGDAVRMVAASTTGRGLAAWGTGAAGIDARGTTQGGPGVFIQSASTLANAVRVEGQANGYATVSIASAGTGADAAELFSSGANSAALTLRGGTTGFGDAIRLQPGASGIDVRTASVKAGTVGSTGNDDTHIHLSGLAGANDAWNGYGLVILDISASRSYFRTISDWVDSSDLAEVSSLGFTPVNTDIYWIFPPDTANMLASILGDTNELQTDWANDGRLDLLIDAITGYLDTEVADILVDTGTTLPAAISGISGAYVSQSGTAQAGAAGTITLASGASSVNDYYNYQIVTLTGGTGAGQARIISDYVGSTKVASVNGNWATTPDNTTTYTVTAFGQIPGASAPTTGEIVTAMDSTSTKLADIADDADATFNLIDGAPDAEDAVQDAMTAQGYTEARAAKIDNADAAVSSRLASGSYTAPDNSTIGTINSKLGGITGSGTNTVLGYFRAMMAKASGLTPTDISSGTSFNNVTDSQEGNRDNVGTAGAGLTEVSGGGGGSITIPVNQVPVPLSRTWSIVRTASTGLKGKLPLSTTESASSNLWAIDFAVDLPTNGRLTDINSVEVISGDEAGLTLGEDTEDADDYGVDKAMAKLRITPTTAGTYVLRVSVDYASADGGGSAVADVTLKVAE